MQNASDYLVLVVLMWTYVLWENATYFFTLLDLQMIAGKGDRRVGGPWIMSPSYVALFAFDMLDSVDHIVTS